jgi:hypothetical protein
MRICGHGLFQASYPGKRSRGGKRMSKAGRGKKSAALVVLIFAFISVTPAYSDVIYSSYGTSDTYDTSHAFEITTSQWWGFAFTPTVSARLDSITLTTYAAAASGTSFTLLLKDSNGLPKFDKLGIYETRFNTSAQTFDFGLSAYNIELLQGIQYWLVMEELFGGTLYWSYGLDEPAPIAARGTVQWIDEYPKVTWGGASSAHAGAFRVEGTPLNAVPEPGVLWLLGSGMIGLIGIRRMIIK